MAKIKNLLKGILHISSAGLRIDGETIVDVKEITPDIKRHIDMGLIAVVTEEEAANQPAQPSKPPAPPIDYDKLDEVDAIEYVEDVTDPKVITNILQTEGRGEVLNALKDRLKEIENANK